MITNLVAAISLSIVTNITETPTDYERYEPAPCPDRIPVGNTGFGVSCAVMHRKGINPTAKAVTTTVKEIKTLTFGFEGAKLTNAVERVISSKTVSLKLDWRPDSP